VDGIDRGSTAMPLEITAGFFVAPVSAFQLAATATHSSWSRVDPTVFNPNAVAAYDTWEVGAGTEIAGPAFGRTRIPIRLGFRYAQLPFSVGDRAREIDLTAGTGFAFSGGRSALDLAFERVRREGGGAMERAWQISVEFRLRP
jgi:hypothetical protein